MRILWLSHTADVGGAELALAEGAMALRRRGHDVHVVLPREGPLRSRLVGYASVHIEPSNRWAARHLPLGRALRWNAYNVLRAGPRLAVLARRLGVDVVVTNTLVMPAAALAARRAGIPHVWFIHEFGAEDHRLRFLLGFGLTLRLIGRLSRVVLVNSDAVRQHVLSGIPGARVRVVPYAVEVAEPVAAESTESTKRGPLRLVLVGAKSLGKGQVDAVNAVAILKKREVAVSLRLVGGGDPEYEAVLHAMCERLDVAGAVEFVPFEPDSAACFAGADVALMCSRHEAFGRVTVEAMKLGKPVIGAAAGATPELIREGWSGLLYQPGHAEELADRVEELHRDRARARAMGERGREWARETFSSPAYGEALEQALLAARASNGR